MGTSNNNNKSKMRTKEIITDDISSSSEDEVNIKPVRRRSTSRNTSLSYKEENSGSDEEKEESNDDTISVCNVEDDEFSSEESAPTLKSTPTPKLTSTPKSTPTPSKKRKVNTKSSAIVKVKKENKGSDKNKYASLPSDWPVSSTTPQYPFKDAATIKGETTSSKMEGKALVPGQALIECSGNDIQLAKGVASSLQPNLDKMKGKYLIILPGMLALHANKTDGASATSATPQTTMQFGRLEKLHTDTPTLTIPLHSNKLVFQGRKIDSTSKFLSLKCTPGTNRSSVDCKGIFSSVIVFPDAALTQPLTSDSEAPKYLSTHYGGSSRTVDGGKQRKLKKLSKSTALPKTPTPKKVEEELELASDEEESDEIELLSSDEDDEEFTAQVETPTSKKVTPKRRSVASVTYKDVDDSAEDDDNEQYSTSSDSTQAKRTPSKRQNNKRKSNPIIKDNESNDDVQSSDIDPKTNNNIKTKRIRKSTPKRTQTKRIVSLDSKLSPPKETKSNICSILSSEEELCDTPIYSPASRFRKGISPKINKKKNLDSLLDDSEFKFIDLS